MGENAVVKVSVKFEARLLCGGLHKNRKHFHELRAVMRVTIRDCLPTEIPRDAISHRLIGRGARIRSKSGRYFFLSQQPSSPSSPSSRPSAVDSVK